MLKTPYFNQKIQIILESTKPKECICAFTGEKWMMNEEEISWYKKFQVPPSHHSPLTRMRLLTNTFSAGQWWYNKHAQTGKPIITWIHPATGIRVLPDNEWFEKDFISENLDYDPSVSIFEQLWQLRLRIPKSACGNYETCENAISAFSYGDINSYFVGASKSKETLYSIVALDTESSAEVYNSVNINNSYQVIRCERLFNCRYIQESKDCLNVYFAFDCRGCEFCFGATNKRNKTYLWFNDQLSKEEWEERFAQIDLGDYMVVEQQREKFAKLLNNAIWPENFNDKAEHSIGEYLSNSTDNQYVYTATGGARGNAWCIWAIGNSQQNFFCADPTEAQENYYTAGATNCHHCFYCMMVSRSQNCEYSLDLYDCENCFACVGLRHKNFCILNTQYSEKVYWEKLDEIKCQMLENGEYGDALPAKFSGCYFPESGAVKYHLADLQFGRQVGAHLFDPNSEDAIGEELMMTREVQDVSEIPMHVDDIEQVFGRVYLDPVLNRRFGFIKPEIIFYQKLHIAPPRTHQIERVRKIVMAANAGVFETNTCQKCTKEIIVAKNSTFTKRLIYCRPCYLTFIEDTN